MLPTAYLAHAFAAVAIYTMYMTLVHAARALRRSSKVGSLEGSFTPIDEEEEEESAWAALADRILKALKVDDSGRKDIAVMLSRAGITSEHSATYFLFCRYVIQPLALLLAIRSMASIGLGQHETNSQIALELFKCALFTLAGLRGTQLFVENRRQKRQQKLTDSFPEVLDLLLVCIESGLGLDAALGRVCKEMRSSYPEIIAELDRTRLELTMLGDRVVALQNLAERIEVVSFKTLVSALIQTEKFGTSLVDTLRTLAEEIRTTRLYAAEQRAARIPVLITLPLIICILPAFILIIIAPPMVRVAAQGGIFGGATFTQGR